MILILQKQRQYPTEKDIQIDASSERREPQGRGRGRGRGDLLMAMYLLPMRLLVMAVMRGRLPPMLVTSEGVMDRNFTWKYLTEDKGKERKGGGGGGVGGGVRGR